MTSVSPVADRPTVVINHSYDTTHTMATIAVMRKPKRRSGLRRALLVLLALAAIAVVLFVTAGIVGTVSSHPAAPAATYPAVPLKTSIVKTVG